MKYPKFDENWERSRMDTMQMYIGIGLEHIEISRAHLVQGEGSG